MSVARRLVVHGELPEYQTTAARIANMDADVRDLTGRMRKSLTDKSGEFTVSGWVLDEESWEMAVNGRTIVTSVLIRRPA